MTAYDENNIFARILRGELPSARIFETDDVVAFMDVMPQSKGHCLVVPKAPSRNVLDASDATLSSLLPAVARLARAAKRAFDADGVTISQFNEAPAGQTVFHLHVHVIPRYEGEPLISHAGVMADPNLLAEQAARIRASLDQDGG
ncbi:HIT family protein [Aureimonas jatrophae]|uniref:Histidine triad (HIT) family protein n=1 Tax=Aureimonas jatrophae TaxID=1166073 RepID=A0A1H0GW65_9HYPH|nr:HIT domain-containing protein [Aureimonas jatrophae]MBB3949825.1 histidine triad (HIT) family protein [Aureimonas jatrophae]SDO11108.1 histidine triad (HIT) family protein [Aureimonas jatrophae]